MKRVPLQKVGSDHKISRMDYYQIFTSTLMVILGTIILFRTFAGNVTLMPLLMGGGFLTLGGYRLKFVVEFFKERRKWDHR
jgi:hypothetical protein